MSAVIIDEATICDAIAKTFRSVSSLVVQSYNELTDNIPETPLLQVYWNGFVEDATTSSDRAASRKRVVVADDTFILDLYAAMRRELAEDIPAVMRNVAAIRRVFYEQKVTWFGLSAIKSVKWTCRRTTLTYGDPQLRYAGARFTLTVRCF